MKLASCQSGFVRIVARERIKEVGLVIKKAVLQVHRERHRVDEYAADPSELVHRLEDVVLIENVLRGAVIRD
jgi:hypothetical protein